MSNANQYSDVLRQISIPLVSDQGCVAYNFQFDYTIDPTTQICAGSADGGKSASDGDSGKFKLGYFLKSIISTQTT